MLPNVILMSDSSDNGNVMHQYYQNITTVKKVMFKVEKIKTNPSTNWSDQETSTFYTKPCISIAQFMNDHILVL